MRIRAGYKIVYDTPGPTPMLMMLSVRPERARDLEKPDGMPRKLMSSARLRATGWSPKIPLRDGLAATYAWYLENIATTRA